MRPAARAVIQATNATIPPRRNSPTLSKSYVESGPLGCSVSISYTHNTAPAKATTNAATAIQAGRGSRRCRGTVVNIAPSGPGGWAGVGQRTGTLLV